MAARMLERQASAASCSSRATSTAPSTAPTSCSSRSASAARRRGSRTRRSRTLCGCIGQETTGAGGLAQGAAHRAGRARHRRARARARGRRRVDRRFHEPGRHRHPRAARRRSPRRSASATSRSGSSASLAALLGVPPERVEVDQVGLNHLTWIRAVRVGGARRAARAARASTATSSRPRWRCRGSCSTSSARSRRTTSATSTRTTPCSPSSSAGTPRAAVVAEIEQQLLELYRDPEVDEKPPLLEQRGGAFYSEAATGLVASLRLGLRRAARGRHQERRDARRACRRRRRGGARAHRGRRSRPAAAGAARAGAARPRPARRGVRAARGRRRAQRRSRRRAQGAARASARRAVGRDRGTGRATARGRRGAPRPLCRATGRGPVSGRSCSPSTAGTRRPTSRCCAWTARCSLSCGERRARRITSGSRDRWLSSPDSSAMPLAARASRRRAARGDRRLPARGRRLPLEEEEITAALSARGWMTRTIVGNDTFAVLRAGTARGWGVAVTCGAGINCVGVGRDGRQVRFPALGAITGDWGGGYDVGLAAVSAAARSEDGRGPRTSLERAIPAHYGLRTPSRARGGDPPARDPAALGDRARSPDLHRGGRRSGRGGDRRSAGGRDRHALTRRAGAARPDRRERRGDARRRHVPIARRPAAHRDRPGPPRTSDPASRPT